jgi:hypothetical protein
LNVTTANLAATEAKVIVTLEDNTTLIRDVNLNANVLLNPLGQWTTAAWFGARAAEYTGTLESPIKKLRVETRGTGTGARTAHAQVLLGVT